VLDRSSFDQIARFVAPESTDAALLFMDTTLQIRGANGAYMRATHRDKAELVGQQVFDAFPDNPHDPQARGTHDLGISFETAMRTGRRHDMPILRFDIRDPADPQRFIPKVWAPRNSPVYDHGQLVGIVHHAEEITEFHGALSAMARAVESDTASSPQELLRTLTAFTAALPRDHDQRLGSLLAENEQLRTALQSRDVIGQAKGMLMERYDIDANAAFRLMVKLSQDSNTKVVEIASYLVEIDHPGASTDQ
jgi:hypothetical protein